MKFFRETTLNKVVVMGNNTLKSFPNGAPLKNRINIVLSRSASHNDCVVVKSLDALFAELQKYDTNDVYVIGGASIYKALLPYCSEIKLGYCNATFYRLFNGIFAFNNHNKLPFPPRVFFFASTL